MIPGPYHSLTAREKQVLVGIAEGKTTKQIAAELGLSPKTAEAHRQTLMDALGLHCIALLTRYAIRNGYLRP